MEGQKRERRERKSEKERERGGMADNYGIHTWTREPRGETSGSSSQAGDGVASITETQTHDGCKTSLWPLSPIISPLTSPWGQGLAQSSGASMAAVSQSQPLLCFFPGWVSRLTSLAQLWHKPSVCLDLQVVHSFISSALFQTLPHVLFSFFLPWSFPQQGCREASGMASQVQDVTQQMPNVVIKHNSYAHAGLAEVLNFREGPHTGSGHV